MFVELEYLPDAATRVALRHVAAFHRALRLNAGRVRSVCARADVDGEGIGLMLSLEGVEPLGNRPELVEAFWALGVRMVGLTWNRRNAFADGLAEPGGLTALGRELVDRLVDLGAILDLAHASERTFADVVERSRDTPLVISHACCRAVHDTPRNASDDQLRAVAERGGVLGLMALPLVVDPERATIERLCDHLDHAVSVMGIGARRPRRRLHPAGLSRGRDPDLREGAGVPAAGRLAGRSRRRPCRPGGLPEPRRSAAAARLRGRSSRGGARRQPPAPAAPRPPCQLEPVSGLTTHGVLPSQDPVPGTTTSSGCGERRGPALWRGSASREQWP